MRWVLDSDRLIPTSEFSRCGGFRPFDSCRKNFLRPQGPPQQPQNLIGKNRSIRFEPALVHPRALVGSELRAQLQRCPEVKGN
jgi:hypothetical protein